jgi:hypothetical protein
MHARLRAARNTAPFSSEISAKFGILNGRRRGPRRACEADAHGVAVATGGSGTGGAAVATAESGVAATTGVAQRRQLRLRRSAPHAMHLQQCPDPEHHGHAMRRRGGRNPAGELALSQHRRHLIASPLHTPPHHASQGAITAAAHGVSSLPSFRDLFCCESRTRRLWRRTTNGLKDAQSLISHGVSSLPSYRDLFCCESIEKALARDNEWP